MTLPVARDLAKQGIRVVTIAPGNLMHAMHQLIICKKIFAVLPFPTAAWYNIVIVDSRTIILRDLAF